MRAQVRSGSTAGRRARIGAIGMATRVSPAGRKITRFPGVLADMETEVVVIGAGQAGLSSAYFLRRAGYRPGTGFVVLDADSAPGGAWQHRWPTLRMATVHGIFDLPGMRFDPPADEERASVAVPAYFARVRGRFELAVHDR